MKKEMGKMRIKPRTYKKINAVGVTLWDKNNRKTKSGKKSITFTVEGITMDELAEFFIQHINQSIKH